MKKKKESLEAAKRLVWDEENIEETGKDRGTRMKITEADTPYLYPGDYSVSGEEESEPEEGSPQEKKDSPRAKEPAIDLNLLIQKMNVQKEKQESGQALVPTADEEELKKQKRQAFLAKRSQHYNEGKQWKKMQDKEKDHALKKQKDRDETPTKHND
uniref:Protein phosphatase inhibitor 2 n=1 Tax=Arcella intermedia TaxID=1963864 RepID=A0A6B2LPB4_9EUKA